MIDPGPAVLQAQALELRRQPAPGIRVLTVSATAASTSRSGMGPGGHPALRNRLVRQALAYGIDRVAIAEGRSADSRECGGARAATTASSSCRTAATTSRTGRAIATGRIGRGGCSSKRAAAGARTASTSVPVAGSRSASRRPRASSARSARSSSHKLSSGKSESRSCRSLRLRCRSSSQILPSGDFDLMLFGWIVGAEHAGASGHLRMPEANNSRATATGWLPATSSRRLGSSTTAGASGS